MTAKGLRGPLPPGGTIGILGGGQLGRMLALAAARLGFRCHVYCPDDDRPASLVAADTTVAPYEDAARLRRFAAAVDVVTYEFENVPGAAVAALERVVPVRPSAQALVVAQDRLEEKRFLEGVGARTAPFAPVDDLAGIDEAVASIGLPAVLKTRRFGYDGKGQALLRRREDAGPSWAAIGGVPAIVESFVAFDCELSVIVARSEGGETACYDVVRNVHERHVLARSIVPAGIADAVAAEAQRLAGNVVTALDYVGVMGVEMFLDLRSGPSLFVNEIAPRVHNSGHWTLDACFASQFEQHVRAICGWPLASPARHSDAVMENLLGDAVDRWRELSGEPHAALHIYDKREARPGRKMGHVTRLFPLGGNPLSRMRGPSTTAAEAGGGAVRP